MCYLIRTSLRVIDSNDRQSLTALAIRFNLFTMLQLAAVWVTSF